MPTLIKVLEHEIQQKPSFFCILYDEDTRYASLSSAYIAADIDNAYNAKSAIKILLTTRINKYLTNLKLPSEKRNVLEALRVFVTEPTE